MTYHSLNITFAALADPTRRAILARLMKGPATVKDLAKPFEMTLPTTLQHLKKLEDSGLIRTEKQGRTRTCHAEPAALGPVQDWIAEQRATWASRLDRLGAYLDSPDAEPHQD